jgi:integrase
MAGSVTFILKDPGINTSKDKKDPGNTDKKQNKSKETPIYLVFWYDKIRIKISTGERINPKYWLSEDHKARTTLDNPDGANLNTRLKTHEINAMNAVRDHLTANGTMQPDKLKTELVNVLRPKPAEEQKKITFLGAIQEYIDTTSKAPRTKKSYGATLSVLKDYQETLKNPLTFDSINMDFYDHFVKYLTYDKTFAKNTIGGHIKEIKVFMDYCNDKGYTTNQGHRHKKFRKMEETAETIYLNDKELETIYKHNFKSKPKFDRIRDLFIIGCYTGLRFSDLSQITPDKIINNGSQLKIKTIKTGEIVIIPLHWTIREILQKYDGNLPRVISNQKFNEYLKKIGEDVKINELVTLTKTKGGLNFETTKNKYDLITVHTARRSFATNMFLADVPTISIMKITGHRTDKAFMKYIKITQEQNADKLAKHKYFIKPLKVVKRPGKKAVNQ